jgi:hypothetical protein
MSALVERIIAARDRLRPLRMQGEESIRNPAVEATDALADAANAITEQDETIHALRQRLAKVEALSTIELQNCARYVEAASNAIEGADRGRELARMVRLAASINPKLEA